MSDSAFGLWLKRRRRALDLTQEDLGERIGYATATIRKFEAGTRRPSREIAERLADALDLGQTERTAFVRAARSGGDLLELAPQELPPHQPGALPAQVAPSAATPPTVRRGGLPTWPTPFVGRAVELGELYRLLADPACRLISLTGPGGMGKTRLAVQAAAQHAPAFDGGVCFVPLGSVASPESLAPSIADALGFALHGADDPQGQLVRLLRDAELLLVLDNVEHLVAGAAELLAEILWHAPRVKLLITSRERLQIQGEWPLELKGLPVPTGEHAAQIEGSAAAALFVQQARRARSDFKLTEADRAAVVRICQLLEGMPLGIELAAAWVRVLSCEEIAQEIERNLDFVAASARDLPARHRSLRAVFDQSWSLLDEGERRVLRRLAVFRGGFTRAAAEAVCRGQETGDRGQNPIQTSATSLSPMPYPLLPILASLMDKSLLSRGSGERYEMHELVRQYAEQQLRADALEYAASCDQHCRYYAAWLQEREDALRSSGQKAAIALISAEIDNLRLAGEWAIAHGRLAEIRQAIRSLCWFYEVRGWLREGASLFKRLARALESAGAPAEPASTDRAIALGQALAYQGWFGFLQGDVEIARALLRRSEKLLRENDARQPLADTVAFYGFMSYVIGDYADARRYLEEGFLISQAIGDQWTAAFCQSDLGKVAYQLGEYREAHQLFAENVAAWRAIGDPCALVGTISVASGVYTAIGEYNQARELLQEALVISSGNYDAWSLGNVLFQLGMLAQVQNEHAEAAYLFSESSALFREIGDHWHVVQVLNALGRTSQALGHSAQAWQCYQEALETALASQALPAALDALAGLADLVADQGRAEQALELLSYVLSQPAASAALRVHARQRSADLADCLTAQEVDLAVQNGRELALGTALTQLRALNADCLDLGRHMLLARAVGTRRPPQHELVFSL